MRGKRLLDNSLFPEERENGVRNLFGEIEKGNLGISLSSFEEINQMTPEGVPFPIGAVNFEDGKRRFVISWRDSFSKIGIKSLDNYTIGLRNYPVDNYPLLSMMVGLHNGKVDPETGEDLWYYGENHLDLGYMLTRIKLYQLLNCEEILFCLFDGSDENLDSFGFSLNSSELKLIEDEIESGINFWEDVKPDNHISKYAKATKVIDECFTKRGLPKIREALNIYLKRKEINPLPSKLNWGDFTSI